VNTRSVLHSYVRQAKGKVHNKTADRKRCREQGTQEGICLLFRKIVRTEPCRAPNFTCKIQALKLYSELLLGIPISCSLPRLYRKFYTIFYPVPSFVIIIIVLRTIPKETSVPVSESCLERILVFALFSLCTRILLFQ
jgi:hypothetical protein